MVTERRKHKGLLISFEGIDGCGKSTQAGRLADALTRDGHQVVLTREPTDGPWGQKIRRIATGGRAGVSPAEEMDYFIRDRRQHVDRLIGPGLEQGRVVITDRYYHSTIAYQSALGLDPDDIRRENEDRFPIPDLVIILKVPIPTALDRIKNGRPQGANVGYEQAQFLEKVGTAYDAITGDNVLRIDAQADRNQVFGLILRAARRAIEKKRGGGRGDHHC